MIGAYNAIKCTHLYVTQCRSTRVFNYTPRDSEARITILRVGEGTITLLLDLNKLKRVVVIIDIYTVHLWSEKATYEARRLLN